MTALVIYGPNYSTYVRTVRLVCEEKGADYRLVELNTLEGAHKTSEHLARHPFGKVPAIEHDGLRLFETAAIVRYLDAVLPGPKLTPADPRAAAIMDQVMGMIDAYTYPDLITALAIQRLVMPMLGGTPDEVLIAGALPRAQISLKVLDDLIGKQPFITGDELSLADLYLAPLLYYFERTPEGQRLMPTYPNVQRWWQAVSGRPSMNRTAPKLG